VQCGTNDTRRRGFTDRNSQSRIGALQYHKPLGCAICAADRAKGGAGEVGAMLCGEMTANLAFLASAGALWRAAYPADKWGYDNSGS
jgi:hypothetical protein